MTVARLRGSRPRRRAPYPLGQIPDEVLIEISKSVVHHLATRESGISGNDFATMFANSIQGEHRSSPVGIGDVVKDACGWSVKTIKSKKPFNVKRARLISGRNSPNYSYGIGDPHADIHATGEAVFSTWNARVDEALKEFDELRVLAFIRNIDTRQFVIFEEEVQRVVPGEYQWEYNRNENLEARDKLTGAHRFTWQFHGSQFTVIRDVPASSRRFAITPPVQRFTFTDILNAVGFKEDWVDIVR